MATDLQNLWNSTADVSRFATRPGLMLGYHGTDRSIVEDVVLQRKELIPSTNPWDWLGHGVYFWDHSASRALEFAQHASQRRDSGIKTPAVVGAVLDLGNCLDLLDYENLLLLKYGYQQTLLSPSLKLLRNRAPSRGRPDELLLRDLDCAVVEEVHCLIKETGQPPFDSVRAVFFEGNPLYPNAGFREKNHIQICIRNPRCIRGFFVPQA